VEGALEAGFRVVRVGGDEGQFRQDVNLEGGPRLLGARIEGRAIEDAPFDSFRFSTRGAGDPQRGARFEAEREGRWRARADWRSAESVFASESDFHERRARRGEVSVALATDPRYPDEPLVGLDLGQARLRGEEKGTLFLNPLLLYSGNDLLRPPRSPEDLDATMRTVGGTLRFLLLGFGVFLRPEWRETLEEPSARLRGTSTVATNVVVTERDFEARSRARSPSLAARVSRSFAGGGIDLDVGLRHGETDVSADLDERIAGTIAGAPFTRTANAHARSRGRLSEIDAETRLRPLEGVELRLRALRREEDEEGRSRTSLLLSTLGFPVDLPFETRFESLSLTGEAELRLRAAEPLDLRMGWRRTGQDLEFVGSTFPGVAPPPDRLVTQGPTAGITLRPAASWSFDLDLFAVDTDEALYEIQAERGLTLRAKLRGRVTRDLSVLLVGAWRRAEVEGFVGEFGDVLDAERTIDAETLSLRWRAGPGAILSAGYGRRRTLLEADAVFPMAGGVTTQGESEFDGVAHVLTGSAELDLSERLTASGAAVYENASGDTAFRFQNLLARLEYEISRAATVGSEVRFVEFAPGEGRPGAGDGTDAWIGLLFARISF
jgi:hypothetical protein